VKKTTIYCQSTQKEYNQLILETSLDVLMYQLADFDTQSSLAGQMWCDMAASNENPAKFLSHNCDSYGSSNRLASHMMLMGLHNGDESDMTTLANIVSGTLKSKYNKMNQLIKQGNIVKVNQKGGYCYLDSLAEIKTPIDECDLPEMKRFVLNGEFKSPILTGKILILENSPNIASAFRNEIRSMFGEHISVINNLKMIPDAKELLTQVFNTNVEVIAFESTSMDTNQIESLKKLIEVLADNTKKYITVYAKVPSEAHHLYKSDSEYINLVFNCD